MTKRPKVTVLGSLNMDISVTVPRLPGPGATVLGSEARFTPGGKGANQAVAAARLGADVRMVGCVGDDDFGRRLLAALRTEGINADAVRQKIQPPQRLLNVWDAIKQNLIQSFSELEPAYDMEKAGEFNPEQPRPKGTEFITNQLARASTMLGNLWYTAWLESGEPLNSR